MATDSVLGLFADPFQIMQQQSAATDQRAAKFAEMDPMQRAQYGIYGGASRIAGGIAGAMGAQDPQLKLQSMRQQVLQSLDRTDPNSLMQGVRKLMELGDSRGANDLQNLAQETALKQSQITRNMREGRAAANKVVEADGRQYLVNSVTGERIADLGTAPDKSTKVTVSPQIKLPTDINALASGYEKAIEGDVSVKNLAGTAKGLINQAATSNNPSAWEAARTQVAKAVGEGKLSNEDIARTGIDPTLIGGVRDWIDKKVVGVPDVKTQQALYAVASYLENTASGRISEKRNNRIKMAQQVNPDVNAAEMFPDYSGPVQTPAGGGKIVDFKDFGKKGK